MVGLLVALGQGAVGYELGFGEGDDDDLFDGFVGWAVVHDLVCRVLLFPGELSNGVGCVVGEILCKGFCLGEVVGGVGGWVPVYS